MKTRTSALMPILTSIAFLALPLNASDLDEFKIKRETVFKFERKPVVTRKTEGAAIAFETKGYCDVTVVVEDAKGKIVRHLASGVLGKNAPTPFQKDSLKQNIIWDGKDDQGRYVQEVEEHTVRVSLGLKPRFEKTLFHSPYKRFGRPQPIIVPTPKGVYVFEGDIVDSVRLFDHKGNYQQTIYPFPANKVEKVKGLRWRKALRSGARMPLKEGYHQATFLSSGYNGGHNEKTGFGTNRLIREKFFDGSPSFNAGSAFAVHGKRIAVVQRLLNRFATDGTSGGVSLTGPKTRVMVRDGGSYGGFARQQRRVFPSSAAFSPDGQWLYLTGYYWDENHGTGGTMKRWLHGVVRMKYDGDEEPKLFAGSMKQGEKHAGSEPGTFKVPTAVVCDSKGRVYVADYLNDRIQVFDPEGKHLKNIPANRPARLMIHQKTGELYVASWVVKSRFLHQGGRRVPTELARYGPFNNPRKLATYPLPLLGSERSLNVANSWDRQGGSQFRVALNGWTDPPTLWMIPGTAGRSAPWRKVGIKICEIGKNKLKVIRDFGEEAHKATVRDAPAGQSRQRLFVNPKNRRLYLFEKLATHQMVEINPDTGKVKIVELPFEAEDLCFDINGHAYLRTGSIVARYDARTWREVPWDYGEERESVTIGWGKAAKVISGLALPGKRASPWYHGGGFGVSVKGNLVVQCFNGASFSPTGDRNSARAGKTVDDDGRKYTPRLYPGRRRWGEIHVWDKHGQTVHEDAVPGMGITDGVAIDKDDNVYVLTNPTRTPDGKSVLNPKTETLIKFRPKKGKVLSTLKKGNVPVPLTDAEALKKPLHLKGHYMGGAWAQNAEWFYGGVGYAGGRCICWNARFALDYLARSFVPEPDHFSVAVLDTNGNLILRIGQYGNVEDGKPITQDKVIKESRSIGGDETAIMHACYVAAETDRRLFIADAGNRRILSVKMDYHKEEKIPLSKAKGAGTD